MLKIFLYALFVAVLIATAAFYQLRLMNQFRPSLTMFERPIILSGVLEGNGHRRGGVVPVIEGHELACGVYFAGVATRCKEVLPDFEIGKPLTATAVLVPTMTGSVWVALSIVLQDGTKYSKTPQAVIQEWNEASHDALVNMPFYLLLIFVGVPLLIKLVFKVTT